MKFDPVLFAKAIADDTRQKIMSACCCCELSVNEALTHRDPSLPDGRSGHARGLGRARGRPADVQARQLGLRSHDHGHGPGAEEWARPPSAPTRPRTRSRSRLCSPEAGCRFTPLTQSGRTYRYSAACAMAGTTTKSDSVLEVESAEAYAITVDSLVDGQKTHEVLRARRIGDCAK